MRFSIRRRYGVLGIKELAQAGSEMVPPLVIATAQPLQLLDDSSVHTAGHITVSSNPIIAGAGTSAGGHHPGLGLASDRGPHR